jgi:carboxypeptidase C (cathepsin A)
MAGGRKLAYEAEADWIVLRKEEKPQAEMFYVRYLLRDAGPRPLTFVFNGGPGASSVYLHMGALGPRRVDFLERGDPLPPPHVLVDNDETWLQFTDLVFIDPIGTGFSRMIPAQDKKEKDEGKPDVEYWQLKRDLESLGEFICKFLSRFHRWDSPIWLVGESYGGFRVAKLTKLLQEQYGVALAGAILVSPALEFTLLDGSDYDALMWLDSFPTMAGAAAYHGRARRLKEGEDHRAYMRRAADFAVGDLLPVLAAGALVGGVKRDRVLDAAADFIGLPRAVLRAKNGRVRIEYFVKNLLRDRGKHLGLYDASLVVRDPYPDRDDWVGPDPTLHVVERVFAAGINSQVRRAIGLQTERDYDLLSDVVNKNWKIDTRKHALESQVGATDDLRYGMSVNPHMKVVISHGVYDLVTPFFSTDRIASLMKLDGERRAALTVKHYDGGHMFYTWKESRIGFFGDARALYGVG